jgi:hypothetical protein
MEDRFIIKNPDHDLSPLTGMTRRHYIDCASYLLERAFTHINTIDDPLRFPIVPGKTYPQPNAPEWRYRSAEFEALERTFTLAGPLIHNDPNVTIKGINLREYYCLQLYRALTPGNPTSLPMPSSLPDSNYQFTCEFGGLFKTLLLMPDTIWPHFTDEQRSQMVETISAWAHHRTTQNNWRIFNIIALSFLKKYGYAIDDNLLRSHLQWILSYHSGDGWYLEQTYNYYSISLFIVYTTIWNRCFGDQYYPEISNVIEQSAARLMESITAFFGRNGYVNMWSRSICYRTWVSGALAVAFMLRENTLDPGWARRLCSGSILQFVTKPEFYYNNIPSLGFYGRKEYMIQDYSCAGSPFLMFLPFICLALPPESPFWTARENDGAWETLGNDYRRTILNSPGLVLVNHGISGTSEIIPGKVYYDDPNYSKLAYNTHFPWEDHNPDAGGTAMEYTFRSLDPRDLRGDDVNFYLTGKTIPGDAGRNIAFTTSQSMVYNGVRNNVIYRQAIMRKPPNNGIGYIIDLAEITIPGGVIRVDRLRLAFEYEITLGHYGLPHIDDRQAHVLQYGDNDRHIITASIPGRRLALVAHYGWDSTDILIHGNRNAEADESLVIYARKKQLQPNPPIELLVTVMLHRTDNDAWTIEELNPIKTFEVIPVMPSGSPLGAILTLADGREYTIDFKDIDGERRC